jgi:hypothetical protein
VQAGRYMDPGDSWGGYVVRAGSESSLLRCASVGGWVVLRCCEVALGSVQLRVGRSGSSTNFRLGFLYHAARVGAKRSACSLCPSLRSQTLQAPDTEFQVALRTVSVLRPVSDVAMTRN